MTRSDSSDLEAALLGYDEALRRGTVSSKEALGPIHLGSKDLAGFRGGQSCLLELECLWPRFPASFRLELHHEALVQSSRLASHAQTNRKQFDGVPSVEGLRRAVAQSGILSEDDIALALADLPPEQRPRSVEELVYELIQRRILNLDQATALCRGELKQLVLGPFFIVEELGRGGMGIVYRACDQRYNRYVALKMLYDRGSRANERLKHEFRSVSHLVHPNLVVLDELYAIDGHWFFTMELIDGCPLTGYVRGTASWSERTSMTTAARKAIAKGKTARSALSNPEQLARLRRAFAQVADGLGAIHGSGKLHRDIKPSNALVTDQDRVILIDFGLAADINLLAERPDAGAGTVSYMSPEQSAGQPLTEASDWYSVGVMLYETLTGVPPFQGNFEEVAAAKRGGPPELPAEFVLSELAETADLCRRLLHVDPKRRPGVAELLRALGCPTTAACIPTTNVQEAAQNHFVGREPELELLGQALGDVRRGQPISVYIDGVSGIGKTALVDRFLAQLDSADRPIVLRGRCYERESVPYKALDGIMDAVCSHLRSLPASAVDILVPDDDVGCLVQMFPALNRIRSIRERARSETVPAAQQEIRRRAVGSLRILLARMAALNGLILFIDDLQWGDLDSATLLNSLLDASDSPGLLLLTCYRSEGLSTSPCLRTLLSPEGSPGFANRRRITLDPLSSQECQCLVDSLLHGTPGGTTIDKEDLSKEMQGNPFFLIQMVEQFQQEGDAAGPGERKRADIARAITQRVKGLPKLARELLNVFAVAGHPLQMRAACRAIEMTPDPRIIALLRSSHFIRTSAGNELNHWEMFHDRVREVVAEHVSIERRRAYHGQLAIVLEDSKQVDPEALHEHFEAAGETSKAAHYGLLAAEQAAGALAFDRAAQFYQAVLKLDVSGKDGEATLRRKLADALANAGHGTDAAQQYLKAADLTTGKEEFELRRLAAEQWLRAGKIREGTELTQEILAAVGVRLPRTRFGTVVAALREAFLLKLRGSHFRDRPENDISATELLRLDVCWSATYLAWCETFRSMPIGLRYIRLALKSGKPRDAARAMGFLAFGKLYKGEYDMDKVMQAFEPAWKLANIDKHPYDRALLSMLEGGASTYFGYWRRGLVYSDYAFDLWRQHCAGAHVETSLASYSAVAALFFLGELKELGGRVDEMVRELRHHEDAFSCVVARTYFGAVSWLAANEPDVAREYAREVLEMFPSNCFFQQHMLELIGSSQIDLYMGDGRRAWDRITTTWPQCRHSFQLKNVFYRLVMYHLRARAALAAIHVGGDHRKLLRSAQSDAHRLEREGHAWTSALARLVRAGVANCSGDCELAALQLQAAIGELESAEMALFAAAARRRLGDLVGGDKGQDLVAASTKFMTEQGVRSPEQMTQMLVPGFARAGDH